MDDNVGDKAELFERLKYDTKVLEDPELESAFKTIDRADFVFGDYKVEAYEDYALPLVEGSTISQPTTVAFMLELLGLRKGERVLEIGSGSGYVLALIAHIVGEAGDVYGTEIQPELIAFAENNLRSYPDLRSHIHMHIAGNEPGFPEKAPYDKILVSGDLENIPEHLIEQLKDNGLLVAPIKGEIKLVQKKGDSFEILKSFPGFAFVPII